jgi:hypothetical protein
MQTATIQRRIETLPALSTVGVEAERRAVCIERVRRENGESNPCRRQGKPGEVLPGQPSYPKVKASRDKSMAVKRGFGRTCQTQRPARPARYGQGWIA